LEAHIVNIVFIRKIGISTNCSSYSTTLWGRACIFGMLLYLVMFNKTLEKSNWTSVMGGAGLRPDQYIFASVLGVCAVLLETTS